MIRWKLHIVSSPASAWLAIAMLLFPGCGKKQKDADSPVNAPSTNEIVSDTDLNNAYKREAAPIVFSDNVLQKRFETLYNENAINFNPPNPGTLIRIHKKGGGRIEGEFTRYTLDGVAISTPDGAVIINRKNISEDTQKTLYEDSFSRNMAEQLVKLESEKKIPVSIDDLYFDASHTPVMEKRRVTAQYMPARMGPARYFVTNGVMLYRGDIVHVIHETNDWICIIRSTNSPTSDGWIPKFSSFMTNTDNKDMVAGEVDKLFKSGFLIDIDPKKNEALVDLFEWRIADTSAIEGKCRMLAIYCGQQKNSRLFWVDVKDALSGKKLAEFSVSKGFKEFH